MSSLHQSRVRILFDAACAFGVSGSCVWAWTQTYASAMLPIAGVAALYGLVRTSDMARRRPVVDEVSEAVADVAPDLPLTIAASEPVMLLEPQSGVDEPVAEAVVEAKAKPSRKPARAKSGRRKQDSRSEAAELVPDAEPEATPPSYEPVGLPEDASPESHGADPVEDHDYAPVTPLFEAEPFVRQQRTAFGRRKFG